jgi:hypothetical protein
MADIQGYIRDNWPYGDLDDMFGAIDATDGKDFLMKFMGMVKAKLVASMEDQGYDGPDDHGEQEMGPLMMIMQQIGQAFPNPEEASVHDIMTWLNEQLSANPEFSDDDKEDVMRKLEGIESVQELGSVLYAMAMMEHQDFHPIQIIMGKIGSRFPDPEAADLNEVLDWIRQEAMDMGADEGDIQEMMDAFSKATSVRELGGIMHNMYMKAMGQDGEEYHGDGTDHEHGQQNPVMELMMMIGE